MSVYVYKYLIRTLRSNYSKLELFNYIVQMTFYCLEFTFIFKKKIDRNNF